MSFILRGIFRYIFHLLPSEGWKRSACDRRRRRTSIIEEYPNVCRITLCISLFFHYIPIYLFFSFPLHFLYILTTNKFLSRFKQFQEVVYTRSLISFKTLARAREKMSVRMKTLCYATSIWIFDEVILARDRVWLRRDKLTPWSIGRNENIYQRRKREAWERSDLTFYFSETEGRRRERYRG